MSVTNQDRVYELYTQLKTAKREKKEAAKMHAENIKRIEEEIDEVIRAEEEAEVKPDAT